MGSLSADFKRHLTLQFPEVLRGRSMLALSGGLDSMVLFELLLEAEVSFSVAHCNFHLRGSDSDNDEKFVEEVARIRKREFHVKTFQTEEYAKERGLSLQVAARELRYQWFDQLLDTTNTNYLITAHHADDNLETFLINLSRGSGLKGLTGIPERIGRIRRPLLPFQREEIQAYAKARKISWREDRSNAQVKYLRNRIRIELIPRMKEVLPSLSSGFKTALEHLKDSQAILDDRLMETWKEIAFSKGDLTQIDIARIESLHNPKAYLHGLFSKFGFTQWADIKDLLTAQSGKMVYSPTHRLLKDRESLLLQRIDTLPDASQLKVIQQGQQSIELGSGTLLLEGETISKESAKSPFTETLDAGKLKFPLIVRKWQKGDYFYPKGMQGRKKLSKFFTDEKLSIPEKENIWLLCSENKVAWVVGMRTDDRFKVTDETQSVLHVEWIPK